MCPPCYRFKKNAARRRLVPERNQGDAICQYKKMYKSVKVFLYRIHERALDFVEYDNSECEDENSEACGVAPWSAKTCSSPMMANMCG